MERGPLYCPPPGLADCVRNGLIMTPPDDHYLLPAALNPLLIVILSGAIRVPLDDGGEVELPGLCLSGASRCFRRGRALPDTRMLTVSLLPGAARLLFGASGRDTIDRVFGLDALLPRSRRGLMRRLEGRLADLADGAGAGRQVEAVWDFLLELRLVPLAAPDIRLLPAQFGGAPAQLAAAWGLGLRQFERRFLDSYGQPLRAYRRQLRFNRMLGGFGGEPGSWATLAADSGYADQAHLIRDVRRFTGHSPAALLRSVHSRDPAFWAYRVAPTLRRQHFGPDGF
ncbi:helix-turn-helix domain-containing protein [Zoogloea sp.]|uniref:AraC family transcriptional regulator n=1 Tax=Zoogloea sp. TaxID=49181 RepID=UPI001416C5FF|nr:MAG: AraC family transcriptional regulator [Zoogloea sp.]